MVVLLAVALQSPVTYAAPSYNPVTVCVPDAGLMLAAVPVVAVVATTIAQTDDTGTDTGTVTETGGFLAFLKANWFVLVAGLLAFFEVIARLTPTSKDDSILSWLTKLLNWVFPNKAKAGGTIIPLFKKQAAEAKK